MKQQFQILLVFLFMASTIACNPGTKESDSSNDTTSPKMIKKRRDDGTLSSINPVDEDGFVHGVKTNFYADGKTIHSKISYQNGRKHGPAIWYYKNGQVYEHTIFYLGRKDGLTKRYYDSGQLMEEFSYDAGEEMPGKKKYSKEGILINK